MNRLVLIGATAAVVLGAGIGFGLYFWRRAPEPPLTVSPELLDLGSVGYGETKRYEVRLRTAPSLGELTEKDLELTHNLGDELAVQADKKGPHEFLLTLRLHPTRARGSDELLRDELEIKANGGTGATARVKLAGVVRPASRWREEKWDVGVVTPGEKLTYRLKVTNPGDALWALKPFRSNCNCKDVALAGNVVPPGETAGLGGGVPYGVAAACKNLVPPGQTAWVEVHYQAPVQDGPASSPPVMVEFDGPSGPAIQLEIKGEVRGLLSCETREVVLYNYSPGGKRPGQEVTLRSRSERRLSVRRVAAPDWLEAAARPADEADAEGRPRPAWKLAVRLNPDKLSAASQTALLQVYTDANPDRPTFYLPVRLEPPLKASPDHLNFGTVKGGEEGRQRITIQTAPDLGDLTEKDLEVTPKAVKNLTVQVLKSDAPSSFVVEARFRPPAAGDKTETLSDEAGLEIKTRDGKVPTVRVKLFGSVTRSGSR